MVNAFWGSQFKGKLNKTLYQYSKKCLSFKGSVSVHLILDKSGVPKPAAELKQKTKTFEKHLSF